MLIHPQTTTFLYYIIFLITLTSYQFLVLAVDPPIQHDRSFLIDFTHSSEMNYRILLNSLHSPVIPFFFNATYYSDLNKNNLHKSNETRPPFLPFHHLADLDIETHNATIGLSSTFQRGQVSCDLLIPRIPQSTPKPLSPHNHYSLDLSTFYFYSFPLTVEPTITQGTKQTNDTSDSGPLHTNHNIYHTAPINVDSQLPFAAEYSPHTGIYDPSFLTSSSALYDFLEPHDVHNILEEVRTHSKQGSQHYELNKMLGSNDGDEDDVVLGRYSTIRRNLHLSFYLESEQLKQIEKLPQFLKNVGKNRINSVDSYIRCNSIMIATDAPRVRDHVGVYYTPKDYTPYKINKNENHSMTREKPRDKYLFFYTHNLAFLSVLYSNQIALKHDKYTYNNNNDKSRGGGFIENSFDITINISDHPDLDYFNWFTSTFVTPQFVKFILPARQFYNYLQSPSASLHTIQLELFLPFIKYYDNTNDNNQNIRNISSRSDKQQNYYLDLEIVHGKTIYREDITSAHDNAVINRFDSHTHLLYRPQCDTEQFNAIYHVDTTPNATDTSHNRAGGSTDSCAIDSLHVSELGQRTFVFDISFSPTIASITTHVVTRIDYLDYVKYIQPISALQTILTPYYFNTVLRTDREYTTSRSSPNKNLYNIISVNGFPSKSKVLDLFDHNNKQYLYYQHFFVFSNYTVTMHDGLKNIASEKIDPKLTLEDHHDVKVNSDSDHITTGGLFNHDNHLLLYSHSSPLINNNENNNNNKFNNNILPLPDLLYRTLLPELQRIYLSLFRAPSTPHPDKLGSPHRPSELESTFAQENLLNSLQMIEFIFDITAQRSEHTIDGRNNENVSIFMHCPLHLIEHNDFYSAELQRIKIMIWFDCITQNWAFSE